MITIPSELFIILIGIIFIGILVINDFLNDRNKTEKALRTKNRDIDYFISVIEEYEEKIKTLASIIQHSNSKTNSSTLSQEDLKRIRFAIHPDRNDGKNQELFIKVNELIK